MSEPAATVSAVWIARLLQTTDSFYPTGTYAHSFGLEGLTQAGVVRDRATLREFLLGQALPQLGRTELPIAAHVWDAAGDPNRFPDAGPPWTPSKLYYSTWARARSLGAASYPKVMFAAVLSWIAGFLAVPVPAGAGIREAVLTASSGLDGGVAAATAIVARIIFILVDVIGAAVSAPAAGRKRGGVRVGPIPRDPESGATRD